MKSIVKRMASALLAASTVFALAAPNAMAEDERRVPSGLKFSDLEKKFDSELNFGQSDTEPI